MTFIDDLARDKAADAMAHGGDRDPVAPTPYLILTDGDARMPIVPGMIVHYDDPILPDPCVVYMPLSMSDGLVFSPLGRGEGPARRVAIDLRTAHRLGRLHTLGNCGRVPVVPA